MSGEAKMVKVTVDGREVEVAAGTPLIAAAEQAGIEIPRFCYHSHLSIAGNCRMCAVEIEGVRGLPISCATPVTDGMIARTDTDAVKAHRAAVMEFLLVNHPIDCPICDQAGECSLQIYYMEHDLKKSRLDVDKVHYEKRVAVGPRVVLDQERCVECTRCIRFCDEISKTGELRMINRGDRCVISTFPEVPLDNDYSVNVADICPVGALTQEDFRFKARVWFLKSAETLCPGCSRGCNVYLDYYWHDVVADHNGTAYRLRPRINDAINHAWMCDFGRDEYHRVNDERIAGARVGDAERPLAGALAAAREALQAAGSETAIIGSLEGTLEEMWLLKRLGDQLGGAAVAAVPDRAEGKADEFLITADKHPNRAGAALIGILRERSELPNLLAGKKAVLIHRNDLLALEGDERLRELLAAIPVRIVVAANASPTTALATHLLPGCSYLEKDGHWVNVDGRLQRVKRGHHTGLRHGAADDVKVLAGLGGDGFPETSRGAFEEMARDIAGLSGITWSGIGSLGVRLDRTGVEV